MVDLVNKYFNKAIEEQEYRRNYILYEESISAFTCIKKLFSYGNYLLCDLLFG